MMRTYWLIARDGWDPDKQLVAGPWFGRNGKKAAKKRLYELKPKWLTITLVKDVGW
jgi:hypothetical protein